MRSNIHPEYHEITIETTNGMEYKTRSTWGKAGDKMKLEIDPDTHPAWTGGTQKILEGGQVARFGRRFQGKSFSQMTPTPQDNSAGNKPPKPTAKPQVKKEEVKPNADEKDKMESKPEAKTDNKATAEAKDVGGED